MLGFIIAGFLIVQFSRELPDAQSIRGVELKVPLRVYSADNLLISEFGNERRKPISYENVPQTLINAILASEDDGFFEHIGVDFKGLFRAAFSNFKSGSSGQGASTITMQVARNFFLTRDKTYTRKLKEVLLAFRLEQILSKQEILSLYLNKIFLGHRAYGFGAAADVYYAKELHELSIAQISMLAGLPKAPSSYNPLSNAQRALIRRNYVLRRLHELNHISQSEYEIATSEPITAQKHSRQTDLSAPHIAEMVRAQLIDEYGEGAYWQGFNVYTTILAKQQQAAQTSLRQGLQAYDRRHGFRGAVGHIDLDPITQLVDIEERINFYLSALKPYPSSRDQIPAIVLNVSETSSQLQTRDFGEVEITIETSKWARRHKTENLVGDRPKDMFELMSPGDVLYIQPQKEKIPASRSLEPIANTVDDISKTELIPELTWKLSQLPDVSGALISMEPATGKVLSLVGGYDFFLNRYNRATQSIRQPGSNIKPFIYSASLDQGFTPASLISGSSIVIRDPAHGTLWRPENYSGKFFGPTRIREALGKSMNLVSIRLLRAIGIPYARQYVQRFGIDMNRFSASLTMALGSGGVKPIEMLSAYSTLANGGYKIQPYFIERITDRTGNTIYLAPQPEACDECYLQYLPQPEQIAESSPEGDAESASIEEPREPNAVEVEPGELQETMLDEAVATGESLQLEPDPNVAETYLAPRVMSYANNFLTVSMMKDVVRRGTARKALALNRRDLAGKTGTTNDYIDAWFTGFNSQVATTVWVGFDKPMSMGRGEAGSVTALPIWVEYMKTGLDGIAEDSAELPAYIEPGFVNRETGQRTDELDPRATPEFFTIDELTPEFALLNDLYAEHLNDASTINVNDTAATEYEDALSRLNDDTNNLGDEILENPPSELIQQERIIENNEDTEGLF